MTFGTLSRINARLARQDGFGIIEVLVSALVVVMAAVGTFAALDSATATSGRNKARGVAASLAQSDQERLRAMAPASLATLPPTTTKTVDGKLFTIGSNAQWIADRTGTPSCSSADGKVDYLKIASTVTWTGMGAIAPVESESLRAVPKGAFRPNEGTIAVKVLDRNGAGVPNIAVGITGATSYNATTNALGCVIIDQVPVGTYTISLNQSGYVRDKLPSAQAWTESTVVAKEQTSATSIVYDRAGTASVAFKTTTAVGSATPADTTGEAFTVSHSGLGSPNVRFFSLPTTTAPAATMSSGTPHALFPFTSNYAIWAGACAQADPQPYGGARGQALVPPAGSAAVVSVHEPLLSLTVKKYTTPSQVSSSVSNIDTGRVVIKPVVAGCARTIILNTNSSGVVTTALPYGDYSICAQEGTTTAPPRRAIVTKQNRVTNGTTYATAYSAASAPPATTVGPPATGAAIMLPYTAQSPSQGECPG